MTAPLSVEAVGGASPWVSQTARIEAITEEVPDVATYHLRLVECELDRSYRFQPGQFNMLYLPGVGEIAIGVSTRKAAGGTWDHTVRKAGLVTTALSEMVPGETLGLRGPFGTSWPLDEIRGADVWLVSGGTGLASLRAALYWLIEHRHEYGRLHLLYGARSPRTLLYSREYADWERSGLVMETTVDRASGQWRGNQGVVPSMIDRIPPGQLRDGVMLCCGSEVMMRFSIRSALQQGLSKDRIWVSLERNMQCAIGLCGHCQLGSELICRDGPVFRYDRVESLLNVEGL